MFIMHTSDANIDMNRWGPFEKRGPFALRHVNFFSSFWSRRDPAGSLRGPFQEHQQWIFHEVVSYPNY